MQPQQDNVALFNRIRNKSRSADKQEANKRVMRAPRKQSQKGKDILIDTKTTNGTATCTKSTVTTAHFILTSRSKSTGKFLVAAEDKIKCPQTSRQRPSAAEVLPTTRSPERKFGREKLSDIQTTVAHMLEKTRGRDHLRRSKSGFSGTEPRPIPARADSQAKSRQRTTSIVRKIEGKIDLKIRLSSQTPTTTSKLVESGSKTKGCLTHRNANLPFRSNGSSITGLTCANTVGHKPTPRNDPVRRSSKGLAIDIESINKCLRKQKVAIQEAKTLKPGCNTYQPKITTASSSTNGKFRSDYLNSLKNRQLRAGPKVAGTGSGGDSGVGLVKPGKMVIEAIKTGIAAVNKKRLIAGGLASEEIKGRYDANNGNNINIVNAAYHHNNTISSKPHKTNDVIVSSKGHTRRKSGVDYNGHQRFTHQI